MFDITLLSVLQFIFEAKEKGLATDVVTDARAKIKLSSVSFSGSSDDNLGSGGNVWLLVGQVIRPLNFAILRIETANFASGANCEYAFRFSTPLRQGGSGNHRGIEGSLPALDSFLTIQAINVTTAAANINALFIEGGGIQNAISHLP
jgi:hypothetical protein